MTLEEFLDHHMDKDVHDVIIVDEQGNEITNKLNEKAYNQAVIISFIYERIIRIKVRG